MSKNTKVTKDYTKMLVIASIAIALYGIGLPLYLILMGPFGSFGLWPSREEQGILVFIELSALIAQIAIFLMLKKWLRLVPFIAGVLTFLVFLTNQ